MKVYIHATHKTLPKVDDVIDNDDLASKTAELEHLGYDVEHSTMPSVTELNVKKFEGFDETPMMCCECCEPSIRCQLTEIESCPTCGSHHVIEIQ